ncbi:5'-methylthioadenosine/adenosylhomocysteine nucleosidase [Salinicoccus halitifaciens]|uniref:5'-methylthioadenosine/S-adenosylhomocysteine nucleosidase n=1 Tax=Salinicoccus halitifaciens TaxID=1073415 RepID=A0ABV2E723_9STAP
MTDQSSGRVIGIIGAMKEEVEILKSWMDIRETSSIAHSEVYSGTLESKNIVLVESGIGKVNSTLITALLIERFGVDMVINTGVAGGLSKALDVTDMVVSTEVCYHDVDATEFGYAFGQVPGMPEYYTADENLVTAALSVLQGNEAVNIGSGLIVSGDSFIAGEDQKAEILGRFGAGLAVDMESASIAQTCHQFEVPFIIIRSISDKAGEKADMTYDEFLGKACINSSEAVKLLLNEL